MKIGYIFAFKEEFPPIPFLLKRIPNEIAALLLPSLNKLADDISRVSHLLPNMNQSMNVYPGDSKFRGYSNMLFDTREY